MKKASRPTAPEDADWLAQNGERSIIASWANPPSCVTSGDTLKIGRRGSINSASWRAASRAMSAIRTARSIQFRSGEVDQSLVLRTARQRHGAFRTIDLGFHHRRCRQRATNVIPAEAAARLNIRFNDLHTPDTLRLRIETAAKDVARQMGERSRLPHSSVASPFSLNPAPLPRYWKTRSQR